MADLKISELSAAGALTGTELVEVVQSGSNVQTTTQDIADLGGGGSVTSVSGTSNRITSTGGATPVIDIAASYDTAITSAIDAKVVDSIADSDTTHAPSRNAVFDALALKADLASPALTGNPTAPTQSAGDNSTKIATTAYADAIGTDTEFSLVQSLRNFYNY